MTPDRCEASHRCPETGFHRLWAAVVLMLLGVGCGSRTGIPETLDGSREEPDAAVDAGDRFDAAVDAQVDAAVDAGLDAGSALQAFCEPSLLTVRPNESAQVNASAQPMDGPLMVRWSLRSSPAGASVRLDDRGWTVAFESDAEGTHELLFEAQSPDGQYAECTAVIEVNNGEPAVRCPEDAVVLAGESLRLEAMASDDDGIARSEWSLRSQPAGSDSILSAAGDQAVFEAGLGQDNAGAYTAQFLVADTDGAEARCETQIRVMAPPEIDCPTSPISAPTRTEIPISLSVREDRSLASADWALLARPPASVGPFFTSRGLTEARGIADRQGLYTIEYVAVDDDGLSASCSVELIGTPTPPTLICPATIMTNPLVDTEIATSAVDDGDRLRFAWSIIDSPMGSAASPPDPAAAVTRFTPDIAGEYTARLVVEDEDGMSASCDILVQAVSDEGLRIEVTWDSRSDMDTHLLNPDATRWESTDDCYYDNCQVAGGLDWGVPGNLADNARLDIDNTSGFGPENINVDEPVPGLYTVGVHAFARQAAVTVRVFCGGTRLTPVASYSIGNLGRSNYWRVADVTINADGTCDVVERRAPGGGPDVISAAAARTSR